VRQIKWSRKGREVKIYEAVEKVIVLLPGKKYPDDFFNITKLLQTSQENREGVGSS
jgi:hypothetical protein